MTTNPTNANQELRAQLVKVHALVRRRFGESQERGEHWQTPPADYDGSQWISDDCDGFCLACRALLRQRGIASRLVYCTVRGLGHLVVEVGGWILDNRQRSVVPNTALHEYRWLRISGYQAGDPWREIL